MGCSYMGSEREQKPWKLRSVPWRRTKDSRIVVVPLPDDNGSLRGGGRGTEFPEGCLVVVQKMKSQQPMVPSGDLAGPSQMVEHTM